MSGNDDKRCWLRRRGEPGMASMMVSSTVGFCSINLIPADAATLRRPHPIIRNLIKALFQVSLRYCWSILCLGAGKYGITRFFKHHYYLERMSRGVTLILIVWTQHVVSATVKAPSPLMRGSRLSLEDNNCRGPLVQAKIRWILVLPKRKIRDLILCLECNYYSYRVFLIPTP